MIDRHGWSSSAHRYPNWLRRLTPTHEIAFFGRVSAGKSSLLNRIIGIDLLLTGVTPVTAVPTRIKNGAASELIVWTADGKRAEYGIDRLCRFCHGNEKSG